MRAYQREQFTVILCILSIAFPYAIAKLYWAQDVKKSTRTPKPSAIYEIRGDIVEEGFYYFSNEQSASGLLQAAGGLKNTEYLFDNTNSSRAVRSGKKIIFKIGTSGGGTYAIRDMNAAARLNFFMPVAINSASVEEMMLIPGIGNTTAEAIAKYRAAHNGIKDLHELRAIAGLGEKKLQSILPYLTSDK